MKRSGALPVGLAVVLGATVLAPGRAAEAASVVDRGRLWLEVAGRLLFGWCLFLGRVVPRVRVSRDGAITALACLVLLAAGLHLFLRWLAREVAGRTGSSLEWRRLWTACLLSLLVVMFTAGIAATGIVHQAGWLLSGREAWETTAPSRSDYYTSGRPDSNLRGLGMTALNYASVRETFPATRYDGQGRPLQSWQTVILPFASMGSRTSGQIDYDQPWDSPRNRAYFRGIVRDYLNPEIAPIRSREGYGLSHYAGNRHVMAARRPLRPADLGQGAGSTILAGEVAAGFRPWGDPANLRDPAAGMTGGSEGFGGPSRKGAYMLFADGSVRFLNRSTKRDVLRKLSIPSRRSAGPSHSPEASAVAQ